MTDAGTTPSARPTSTEPAQPTPTTSTTSTTSASRAGEASPPNPSAASKQGVGHTRTSGMWAAVVGLVVLLLLLAIFVLQNVQEVEVSYFGWQGRAPLASALLLAAASGALIAVVAGTLRILQLRRRVRRAQRH